MKIQELIPAAPRLQELGIQVHAVPAIRLPENPEAAQQMDPQESLTLAGLQLLDLGKAYLVVEDQHKQPLEIDLQRLNPAKLLQSLQQLGSQRDLAVALHVQSQVSELVQAMRQAQANTSLSPLKMVIEGAFGRIELDLHKLKPESLQSFFRQNLEAQSSHNLQRQHQQLAGLSHLIRANFGEFADQALKQGLHWIELSQQTISPLDFMVSLLGHNPLNEELSVRALLQQVNQAEGSPDIALLSERTLALVEAANRLGDSLELAPTPDSPDVLELLQAFLAILRQLESDLAALHAEQDQHRQLERKLLSDFAARQRAHLSFHQDQLQSLDSSAQRRLMLGINHSLQRLKAWAWLNTQRHAVPELETMLRQLGQHQYKII